MVVKYFDETNRKVTIRADRCSGEIPAHSSTFYCLFYRAGKQVARVAKSQLLPGYYRVYEKLFGRPWLEAVMKTEHITLTEYDENLLDGLPEDYERVWAVNSSLRNWVIECPGRSILHILNNEEIARKGTFKEALLKLFPGKKIKIYYPTVRIEEVG
jgi:hypothetical protein